jgi:hypothetical protein
VFFLGLQTPETFVWVLTRIYEAAGQKWETHITAESSALMDAIPEFVDTVHHIRHYVCISHTYVNVRPHTSQLTCSKDMMLHLIRLTQAICDGKSRTEVEHALNEMIKIEIAPDLGNDLDINVHPLIPWLSD